MADQLGEIGPFQAAIFLTVKLLSKLPLLFKAIEIVLWKVLALFFVVFWEENYGSSDEEALESR